MIGLNKIRIPIAKPILGAEEYEAVRRVLESGILAHGPEVEAFEKEFADYVGVKHAVAVANGTAALDVALKAIGIKPGDEVITTPFTFIATANSILFQGARPVFADIDLKTYNIDPESVNEKITGRTRAIIAVDLYGQPADMKALREIADDHGLILVEDAAQAHGAEFMGRKTGSLGDIAAFSFYPTKNMTTGEGGMITTDNDEYARRARLIRNHGQERKYLHVTLGWNLRMTSIAAAIGRVQLKKLNRFNEVRRRNAARLTEGIRSIRGLKPPYTDPRVKHVYHQYVVWVGEEYPLSRDQLIEYLRQNGIGTAVHYPIPIFQQPLYKDLGYPQNICPNSIEASKHVLSLPVHPAVTLEDIDYILNVLRRPLSGT
jgi:perosamine synthetase